MVTIFFSYVAAQGQYGFFYFCFMDIYHENPDQANGIIVAFKAHKGSHFMNKNRQLGPFYQQRLDKATLRSWYGSVIIST